MTRKTVWVTTILLTLSTHIFGQFVGVNTQNPATALDVNGVLRVQPYEINVSDVTVSIPEDKGYIRLVGNPPNYFSANLPDLVTGSIIILENDVFVFSCTVNSAYTLESGKHQIFIKAGDGWKTWHPDNYFTKIYENNKTGFRISERNPQYYANIGNQGVDLSYAASGASPFAGASGDYSFATGYYNAAFGLYSSVFGSYNLASGTNAVAIGRDNNAWGNSCFAGGELTDISGNYSFGFGYNNTVSGFNASSLGNNCTSSGAYGFTVGLLNTALGQNSFAIGNATQANGFTSVSMGQNVVANGDLSIAGGLHTHASAYSSLAFGRYNDSYSGSSTSQWVDTDPLVIFGNGTSSTARSNAMTLFKNGTLQLQNHTTEPQNASDKFFVLNNTPFFGSRSLISQLEKVTEDSQSGWRLLGQPAQNYGNIGQRAVDFSYSSLTSSQHGATGSYSAAFGHNTTASATAAFATGFESEATGEYTFVSGYYSKAQGNASSAMGSFTTAHGQQSFSSGYLTDALGSFSASLGNNTKAVSYNSLAFGRFNDTIANANRTLWVDTDPLITAGNGVNGQLRNAMVLYKNGVLELQNHTTLPNNTQNRFYVWNQKPYFDNDPLTGYIEKITESGSTGYRIFGANPTYYGPIGVDALDLSFSFQNSNLNGATAPTSVAFGFETQASGVNSFCAGNRSKAKANLSSVFGKNNIANGYSSMVVGQYNDTITSVLNDPNSDFLPLFLVGNGSSESDRSNALSVMNDGRIFMGYNSPSARVSIKGGQWDVNSTDGDVVIGDAGAKLKVSIAISGAGSGIARINSTGNFSSQSLFLGVNGHDYVRINNNGYVGLGINAVHPIQHVNGARLTSAGVWTNASDKRLKRDIKGMTYGLKEVLQLKPYSYIMKADSSAQIGFIAQEVQKILPEVVHGIEGNLENGETLGIAYGNMVTVLTRAIQDQQVMIEVRDNKISSLEEKLASLEQKMNLIMEQIKD